MPPRFAIREVWERLRSRQLRIDREKKAVARRAKRLAALSARGRRRREANRFVTVAKLLDLIRARRAGR